MSSRNGKGTVGGGMHVRGDGNRARVTELSRHIKELDAEVRHLREAAKREVEERWALHHTDLFPRFLRWQESVSAENFAVFTVKGKELRNEPLLGSPGAPKTPGPLLVPSASTTLDTYWGGSAAQLVAYALASREMQVHMGSGVACIPLAFFERVTGLVLARIPGLSAKTYPMILDETRGLLDHVREIALAGYDAGLGAMDSAS